MHPKRKKEKKKRYVGQQRCSLSRLWELVEMAERQRDIVESPKP